jgi:hypothetical protein
MIAALAVLGVPGAVPAIAAGPVVTLRVGAARYWPGAFVASGRVDDPAGCGVEGACFSYGIRVLSAGAKDLRVALDSTDESNGWQLRLLAPDGTPVAGDTTYQEGGLGERLDAEVDARKPVAGLWTAQVVPQNVVEGSFRMRAKLESATDAAEAPAMAGTACVVPHLIGSDLASARARLAHAGCALGRVTQADPGDLSSLLVARQNPSPGVGTASAVAVTMRKIVDLSPDIAPDPPWHLTFAQPLPQVVTEGGNVTALAGIHNPLAQVGGEPVYHCLPEETAEQHAQRCLRFSSGVASIGTGRFEVFGSAAVPVALDGGPLFQTVTRSDGTTRARAAGRFIFHQIHAHYHVLDLAEFPLYRVLAHHRLVLAGKGLKEGFCLGNLKIYDWHSFAQDFVDPNSVDNCEPSANPSGIAQLGPDQWRFYEGIARGWEDVYTWATSGQYVDFGNNPDGTYLMRMRVNAKRSFLEDEYTNDVAYTYFAVRGNDVRVLERGRGTGPWDPHKVVLDPEITR